MMIKVNSVEEYLERHEQWTQPLQSLRGLLLATELIETIKWNAPVYTLNGKNVVGMAAFKQHFGIWFFNGVFLKDPHNVLVNAQEGKTKALRQMRFNSADEMNPAIIKAYIREAIENQKLGKAVKADRTKKETVIPELLERAMQEQPKLLAGFKTLSDYKKREFCDYIESAKREATKLSRLEKIKPMIQEGIGLNDKYRK